MSYETVFVPLPGREYEIRIGSGLLADAAGHLAPFLKRPRVAVITEARVSAAHRAALEGGLAGIDAEWLELPPGESTKSWEGLRQATEFLLKHRFERSDLVIAFGGGVIGDLAGFAAAIARRGLRFVQVPTTLLAQVDSSVGGKTGINTPEGKNLAGAFHQPVLVLADLDLLATLPERDYLAGYGEVVKYGLLGDAHFFAWLEANAAAVKARDPAALAHAVRRSCEMKAGIVTRDETEQGERALLNLGHTFCHALEAATGYGDRLLHGEGVAIGCALAFELSARLGLCPQEEPGRVAAHLEAMGLKRRLADIAGELPDAPALMALMMQDKKVQDGRLRFILARGIGEAFVTSDVPGEAVEALLTEALSQR
ncbi:3-dehydroquinate synthase [Pseudoroseicyclus sp. CXY001]|uniref:3-dehydroquinate synthase n=1 Tax=Pseudoroseicyclus sp. CXY001 TaxID=3242492 RepID=UPI00358DBFC1